MTNCVTLTHEDAFANIKLLEELESLPQKKVYGFGVDGKRFKIIKMDDSFFTRIWYSILKFLKFIKADDKSVTQLKQYTFDHLTCNDYKKWAATTYNVSKVGIKELMEDNEKLKGKLKEGKCQHTEADIEKGTLQGEIETHKSTIKDLQTKLRDLQLKLAQAQSQSVSAIADSKQVNLTVEEQAKAILEKTEENQQLRDELEAEKKSVKKYKSRSRRYDEERSYLQEAWKVTQPDKSSEEVLKEKGLYQAIHDKFHHHKSHKNKDK